jgi:glutamine synthetase
LETILSTGERIDGSSLFNFLTPDSSDLYIVPRFKTAFLNPFSEIPAVDILCSIYDKFGKPLGSAPENIMRKAHQAFADATGCQLEVMGEIEYYVISKRQDLYVAGNDRVSRVGTIYQMAAAAPRRHAGAGSDRRFDQIWSFRGWKFFR